MVDRAFLLPAGYSATVSATEFLGFFTLAAFMALDK
jgi:hypothetical protein